MRWAVAASSSLAEASASLAMRAARRGGVDPEGMRGGGAGARCRLMVPRAGDGRVFWLVAGCAGLESLIEAKAPDGVVPVGSRTLRRALSAGDGWVAEAVFLPDLSGT